MAAGSFAGWLFGAVVGADAPCAGAVGAGAVGAGAGAVCAGGVFVAEFCDDGLLAGGVCATTLAAKVVTKLSSRAVRMGELQRRSQSLHKSVGTLPAVRSARTMVAPERSILTTVTSAARGIRRARWVVRPFDSERDVRIETDPWNLTRRRARCGDGDRREAEPVETGGGSAAILTGPALLFT